MIALLLTAPAWACPTIATGTIEPLEFDVAQVAIVREDNRTTFSVSINPSGDKQEFALVLPVPEVLEEAEVRTLDPTLFGTLDAYTAPRHVVNAGCGGYYGGYSSTAASDNADTGSGGGSTTAGVDVEAEYLVGEYQVTILSAQESNALDGWLDDHGYFLPEGAPERLAEYIDAGSYFLAAKVADEAAAADGTPLSPLQVSYDNDLFAIPIRLATLSSPGEQDMVIYSINAYEEGRAAISNYPEFEVTDKCVWQDDADDFGAFYDAQYSNAWDEVGDAGWTVEFAGGPWDCNPCSGVWLDETQLSELGFTGDYNEHYMTRIHMRYTTAQADEELSLYTSRIRDPKVTAFADDVESNYSCVDSFCDGSPTPEVEDWNPPGGDDPSEDGTAVVGDCACGTGPAPTLAGLLVAAAALARRRNA